CLLVTPRSRRVVLARAIGVSVEEGGALEVRSDEPGLLSADGRPGMELPVGSEVTVEPADRPARLVRRANSPGFFALLREKFSLPGAAPHAQFGPGGPGGEGPARMA